LQSTALIITLELLRLEYYITGYALLHCSNLVDFTLQNLPVAPMQVNRSWSL